MGWQVLRENLDYSSVVLGEYRTRAAAEAACAEYRRRYPSAQVYVSWGQPGKGKAGVTA